MSAGLILSGCALVRAISGLDSRVLMIWLALHVLWSCSAPYSPGAVPATAGVPLALGPGTGGAGSWAPDAGAAVAAEAMNGDRASLAPSRTTSPFLVPPWPAVLPATATTNPMIT